jgi:hypothetical protein
MSKKESEKKWKAKILWAKQFFYSTLPFSPWAILATWLHVRATQKIQENKLNIHFEQNFTTGSYKVGIGQVWCA